MGARPNNESIFVCLSSHDLNLGRFKLFLRLVAFQLINYPGPVPVVLYYQGPVLVILYYLGPVLVILYYPGPVPVILYYLGPLRVILYYPGPVPVILYYPRPVPVPSCQDIGCKNLARILVWICLLGTQSGCS